VRWFFNFHLAGKSDWKEKWEELEIIDKRKEIINLIEVLQAATSEYRQGLDDNEIIRGIREKMSENVYEKLFQHPVVIYF